MSIFFRKCILYSDVNNFFSIRFKKNNDTFNAPVIIILQNESYIVSVYSHVLEGIEETHATANANFLDSETTADKHVIANESFATT